MIQHFLIGLLFAGAVFYVGRLLVKTFTAKGACGGSCKCGNMDLDKIEKEFLKKQRA